MSRRSGQSGSIEKKGNAFSVRFRIDVPGQEKRAYERSYLPGNCVQQTWGWGLSFRPRIQAISPQFAPSCTRTSLLSNVA